MRKKKKTKDQRIQEAVDVLNKAMEVEEPHIQIRVDGGFFPTPESEKFLTEIKNFVQVYKKFYGLEKIDVRLLV